MYDRRWPFRVFVTGPVTMPVLELTLVRALDVVRDGRTFRAFNAYGPPLLALPADWRPWVEPELPEDVTVWVAARKDPMGVSRFLPHLRLAHTVN